jgi:eukaryotic-like serine/threonine-protein kinase
VGKVHSVVDTSVSAGDVSSTSPFAGETEALGTPITVYLSSGPGTKAVPPVIGDSEAAAQITLQNAGFSVGVSTRTTNSAPAGTVVSQSPAANTQASPGSTVTIVVAQRPPPVTKTAVPGVTGDTAAAARSALVGAGFSVSETTRTVTNKSSNGIVLAQSPAAGTRESKGTTVTIVVGSYKQPTTPTTPTTTTKTTPKSGPAVRVQ